MKKRLRYRIQVQEIHEDYVWVEADSPEEAELKAHSVSECEFSILYDVAWNGDTEEIK